MIERLSPNFTRGRDGHAPIATVLHIMDGTFEGTAEQAGAWFADKKNAVSAHFGVGRNGQVAQYVREDDAAWANGTVSKASWSLLKKGINPNLYTFSIEHEGKKDDRWTMDMRTASAWLVRYLHKKWEIPLDREHVIGHYQLDLARRPNCPATDKSIIDEILRLAIRGVDPRFNRTWTKTLTIGSKGADVKALNYALWLVGHRLGVGGEIYDADTAIALLAAQRGFLVAPESELAPLKGESFGPKTRAAFNAIFG